MCDGKINVGCSEQEIKVPLFTELYGYGPFLGRRNRGVLHPLYCRCASFSDGKDRVVIISNDLVTIDSDRAWDVRRIVQKEAGVKPENIMVCGSHTHSGATISPGVGWGELNPDFVSSWVKTAAETAVAAVEDETPAVVRGGKSPLAEKIGTNRVWDDGPTDPEIRWAGFYSEDGSLKLLMHNHGMHGVAFGRILLVSADWPGAVNTEIINRDVARHALFLYGAAGDINTYRICSVREEGEQVIEKIKDVYMKSLVPSLHEGVPLPGAPVTALMRRVELPTEEVTPEYLRATALKIRDTGKDVSYYDTAIYQADRMEEMAIYMEAGGETKIIADCQVLRVGGLLVYAVGGEPFYEVGREILDRSPGEIGMVAAIANDNFRYIPTPQTFAENPEVVSKDRGYGYYEVHCGFGRLKNKFRADIGTFLIDYYLKMATEISLARAG